MDDQSGFMYALKYTLMGLALLFVMVVGVMAITGILGPTWNSIDNALFNTSPMHQQGVAGELTTDCTQLAGATTDEERHMINVKIVQDAKNVDVDHIEMDSSVRVCVHQAIQNAVNGQ